MNPLTNVKNITKLNEIELATGLIHKKSWHDIYKDSAWIFIGGLEYGLTEGDVITVFSQYGEIVNINLVRDKKTGKSKGYCFLCYANQKSTVLAVDNLNGIKLCNRTIRVDHVNNYKPPKEDERDDEITKILKSEGCAPKRIKPNENDMASNSNDKVKKKKSKKEKKKKKRKHSSNESDSGNQNSNLSKVKVKREKVDPGYDKYDISLNKTQRITEKRSHQERNFEERVNENSNFQLKSDQLHWRISERNNKREDQIFDKHRSKERSECESQRREKHKGSARDNPNLSKVIRKDRLSSSSDDSSRNHMDNVRQEAERTGTKSKHLYRKRRERRDKPNTSSSSEEESSSQSSSEDDRSKSESRYSKSDKYKNYYKEKSYHGEKKNKHDYRSKNSDSTSDKRHSSAEKDSEYSSKNKYRRDERYDNFHGDSYSKSKHERR